MAASRTMGKGRVLGAAARPAPPSPSPSLALHDHLKPPGLLSPSASTLSLESEVSTSKSSNDGDDIRTAIELQARENVAAAASTASSRLVCPICNEEMMTLLQLNRHLDDNHKHLEVVEQDEVKTWFKTQMVKAKRFQPLAVLNEKLKKLDIFEDDDLPAHRHTTVPGSVVTPNAHLTTPPPPIKIEPEIIVTRDHWQRQTPNGACSDPLCGKRLGNVAGNINCRKCGKLFCEEHTMYQMKLSRTAQHDTTRGTWSRVCETCYKSRDGYSDSTGFERNHTSDFSKMRRQAVDRNYLEVSRLEKRVSKLTQLLTAPGAQQETSTVGYLWSFAGAKTKSPQRALEQSVVDWEDDTTVAACPFCQQDFSTYSFRRHHCRLCGRVVCADPNTSCSNTIILDIAQPQGLEDATHPTTVGIRMCKDCQHTLFSKRDFAVELSLTPADLRTFRNLKEFENGIRAMLPRFQKLLQALQDPLQPPTSSQISSATRVRRRLTDAFTQYDAAARRIRDLPTSSLTQARLQKQVHIQASQFLHLHMLPLKSLPKVLKHATPNGLHPNSAYGVGSPLAVGSRSPALSDNGDGSSVTSIGTRIPTLKVDMDNEESRAMRESLVVLEEQKFLVSEMLSDAIKRRKFEEVESLTRNLEDLSREADRVSGMLAEVQGPG